MNSKRSAAQLSAEGADFIAREEQLKVKSTVRGKRKAGDSGDEQDPPKTFAASPRAPAPDKATGAAAAAAEAPRRKPRRVTIPKKTPVPVPVSVPAPSDDDADAAADS